MMATMPMPHKLLGRGCSSRSHRVAPMKMGINSETYSEPAKRGDVTGIAIRAALIAMNTAQAFERLKRGEDISENIENLRTDAKLLEEIFDRLSGWSDDGE